MNCAFHTERTAVAQCVDCGRGLCEECASKFNIAICENCYDVRIINDEADIAKEKKILRKEARRFFWGRAFWGIIFALVVLVLYSVAEVKEFKRSGYTDFSQYLIDGFNNVSYTVMEENPENPGEMIEVECPHNIWEVFIFMGLAFGFPFGWHAANTYRRNRTDTDRIVDAIDRINSSCIVDFFALIIKITFAICLGWLFSFVYLITMYLRLAKLDKN